MAEGTFLLNLVTPERTLFSGPVQELVATGVQGEFGVLPGHANMLAELAMGRLLYRDSSGEKALVAEGGFAEVTGERVTILLDRGAYLNELDKADLQEEIAELEGNALAEEEEGFKEWRKKIDWKRFCFEQAK